MSERPKPYLTEPRRRSWSGWLWLLVAVSVLWIGREPRPPWERTLLFLAGLAFFVEGIDAVRSGRAGFRFSVWYGFQALRSEQPIRFWVLSILNFGLGAWVMAASVLEANP